MFARREQSGSATSEDARHRTPTVRALVLAGRTTVSELDILHAFAAEDGPHPRHQQKKLQLCRWLEYKARAGLAAIRADETWGPIWTSLLSAVYCLLYAGTHAAVSR